LSDLEKEIAFTISETNGIALIPTLELMLASCRIDDAVKADVGSFLSLLRKFHDNEVCVSVLLQHPFAFALKRFFKCFPIPFREEHIHLTGSLTPEFIFPRLTALLAGPKSQLYREKIEKVYGVGALYETVEDLKNLLVLKDNERFDRYLQILYLPKLILIDREAHEAASYHMAKSLFEHYNVGSIRLKFTYSRANPSETESIIGADQLSGEDVILGLDSGFRKYKAENPSFTYWLSPCFRKEPYFFDSSKFRSKKEHFDDQVNSIIDILNRYPQLYSVVTDVDTVGDERDLFRKEHFSEMADGFRRLQALGISVRSHHGETFHTLRRGVQAVDNAMNIWRIDTLEHGLSLGINPNYYYQTVLDEALRLNISGIILDHNSYIFRELSDMNWGAHSDVFEKLKVGERLQAADEKALIKVKFHHAQGIESYQHDVLNRLLDKEVNVTALPSSNQKLTGVIPGYKDHPFSWWEKKGVRLGVGTDNYVTLGTDYLNEMLLLLLGEPDDLKIMKLLMVATGESRRPYLSTLLWETRKKFM